jgi:hypothetical protein
MASRLKSRRRIRADDLGEEGGAPPPDTGSDDSDAESADSGDHEHWTSDEADSAGGPDASDAVPEAAKNAQDASGAPTSAPGAVAGPAGGEALKRAEVTSTYYTFDPANFHLPPTQSDASRKVSLASLVLPDPAVPALEAVLRVDLPDAAGKAVVIRGSDAAWKEGSVVEWNGHYSETKQLEVQDGAEAWQVDVALDKDDDAGWEETGDGDESRKVLEFALKLTTEDEIEEWDSNGGENYRVVLLRRRITEPESDAAGMVSPDERINWADERPPTPPSEPYPNISTRGGRGRGAGPAKRGPVPARPSKTMLAAQRAGQATSGRGGKRSSESSAPGQVEILRKPREEAVPTTSEAASRPAVQPALRGGNTATAPSFRGRGRGQGFMSEGRPPVMAPAAQFWGHDDRSAPGGDNMGGGMRGRGARGRGRETDRMTATTAPTSNGARDSGDDIRSQGGSESGRAGSQSSNSASNTRALTLDEIPYGSGTAMRGSRGGGAIRGGRGDGRGGRGGRYQTWDPIDEKLLKDRWPHDGFDELNAGAPEPSRRGSEASRGRGRGAPRARANVAGAPARGGSARPYQTPVAVPVPVAAPTPEVAPEEPEIVVDFNDMQRGLVDTTPVAKPVPVEQPVVPSQPSLRGGRGGARGGGAFGLYGDRARSTSSSPPNEEPKEPQPTADKPAPAPVATRALGSRPAIIPQGNSMFQALAAAAQSRGLERKAQEEQQKKRAQEREVRAKEELVSGEFCSPCLQFAVPFSLVCT